MILSIEIMIYYWHSVRIHTTKSVNCCHTMFTTHKPKKKWSLEIIIQCVHSVRKHTLQKGWIVATPHDQWSQHKQTKIKYSSRSRLLCSIRIQCDEQTSKVRIVATPYEQWSQHKKKQKNTFIARDFFTAFAFSATNIFQKVRIVATPYDHAHNHNK